MKRYFITLLIILLFPLISQAEAINAGFVSGVWYSQEPFFAGDNIRIYSAIQNQSGFDITGELEFYDNQNLIGVSDFSVISGRLLEKWVDWQVTEGQHSLYTRITNAKKSEVGQAEEPVELKFAGSSLDEVLVDKDSDGDRIGDSQDEDDDNDGVSDQEEIEKGTNPLDSQSVPAGSQINNFLGESEFNYSQEGSVQAGDDSAQVSLDSIIQDKTTQKVKSDFDNYVVEPVKTAFKSVSEQSQKITEELTKKAEEKKLEVEDRLKGSSDLFVDSGEGAQNASQNQKLTKDEIYLYFLIALIYVLNTWWLLLIAVFIVLRIIWRIIRRLMWL